MVDTLSAQWQWKGLIVTKDNIVSFADWYWCYLGWRCCCSMGISLAKAICVAQSGRRRILWSTTLVAAWRNLVNVACCNATQKVFDYCIYCDGGCRQTNFIVGAMVLHCNGKGLWFSMIDLTMSAFAPSGLLKIVAQSPIVVRGLSLPCRAYTTLLRLVITWHNVHVTRPCGKMLVAILHDVRGQLPLW